MEECRISDQKVVDRRFDSRISKAPLCFGKNILRLSTIGVKQTIRCGRKPDERLFVNRSRKRMLCVGVVRQGGERLI